MMTIARFVLSCFITIGFCIFTLGAQSNSSVRDWVQYVNPLMGTDSEFSLSNGNTYPAIATPWGMNFWTPMTHEMGNGWTYQYDANKIRGIKQTHQPSPWINDYAAFSLMAVTDTLVINEHDRESWFSHKAETVLPHYYQVYLADYDVTAEVTPGERAAQFRFTFPESDESYILLDAFNMGSEVRIIPEENKIIGYCKNNHGGVPENFANYFMAVFDRPFELLHTWTDSFNLQSGQLSQSADHVGAVVGFKTKRGDQITVKVASSFISPEQAEQNLLEVANQTFEQTKQNAWKQWNDELGRIAIQDDKLDAVRTFYSCLYRLLLFPRKFYEVNPDGEIVHYSPYNGQIEPGYMFTDNGFWDTFRAVFPFFNLMYPTLTSQIMQGLVNTYKESGWLPEWASPGHRDCMIGSNSASLIADAYLKGIEDFDIGLLYEALIKNATVPDGRPVNSVGRAGLDDYLSLGYVSYDQGPRENAARTLEYAYADYAISQLAQRLGKKEDAQRFYQMSQNYQKLYDPETGWMRGRNQDGSFMSPFNPLKWGDAFTEGNSLHYTWSVFQDIEGLIQLMGGKDAFIGKLDTVFQMPPDFDDTYYGFTIHEIREMQIMNMGNYAHGNQPIQHMIYLYNYAGQPWKSQALAREVMTKLYQPTPDGYCGDEDNGQTSAWYVFSALGFYPVTPVAPQYVIGSPLFEQVNMHFESGNTLTIKATNQQVDHPYIDQVQINGQSYSNNWFGFDSLRKGGIIQFNMSAGPNTERGTFPQNAPFSMSHPNYQIKP